MKKQLLALLLLLPLPLHAQTYDAGSLQVMTPDRTATATMGALNAAVSVLARGRQGIGVYISTANLNAVVTPECSPDGSVWFATSFVSSAGVVASTLTFGGGADSQFHGITLLPGCQNARARISTYTSGTSSGRIVATATAGLFVRAIPVGTFTMTGSVTQGTSPWVIGDGGGSITIDAVSLPLPTGAATEATLGGVLTTTAFQARINTLGQKTMANSTPMVLASDQTAIPVGPTVTPGIGTTNLGKRWGDAFSGPGVDVGVLMIGQDSVTGFYQAMSMASGGAVNVIPAGGSIGVISTSINPGTGTNNLGKAEDGTPANGDVGVSSLWMREDTPTSTASNSRWVWPKTDSVGRPWVDLGAYAGSTVSSSNAPHSRGSLSAQNNATWTSASGAFSTVSVTTTGYDIVLMEILCTGTVSSGGVFFRTNNFITAGAGTGIRGLRTSLTTSSDGAYSDLANLITGCSERWIFNVTGATTFTALLSPVITGAGSVDVSLSAAHGSPSHQVTSTASTRTALNDGSCVSVGTGSTSVLAASTSPHRQGLVLFARETNTAVVHVKMGTTATTADFPMPAGSAMNLPIGGGTMYIGAIDAISASGTQSLCLVEF